MSTRKLSIMMFCLLSLAVFLYACGSSSKSGSASGTPDTVVSVGDSACRQCHSAVLDPLTGEGIIVQYDATSPHRNSAHANNGNGCEACHGGGGQHNGVGPIPYPNPYADNGTRCASCHAGNYATNAPTQFAGSRHAKDMTIEEGNPCRRCHTHEGAVLGAFYGLTGPGDVMHNEAYQGAVPSQKEFTVFECATCHQHGGGLRRVNARDDAGNVVVWNPSGSNLVNDQFNLCTSCHGLKALDGSIMASGTAASGTVPVGYHENTWYRIIATTHNNNLDNEANGITGYVIRSNGETACFDCHGHEARTETQNNPNATSYDPAKSTIYRDWAMSGHAGGLLNAKYDAAGNNVRTVETVDAVMNAAVHPEPWYHYDWSGANRQACQRCHTATGVSNFLTSPSTYNPANNDYSHLAGWGGRSGTKTSKQREMLYCWGCHKNTSSGLLRNPGAITETYSPGTAGDPATVVTYPDAGSANVCLACHLGREIGDVIKNDQDADGVRSFINSHYLSAGGTVFGKTGYTFFGRDYDSTPKGFVHDKLGISATGDAEADAYIASNGLSKSGPCVVCHLTSEKLGVKTSHRFSPFTEYAGGDVSLNPVCVNCHSTRGAGSNAQQAWFEDQWKARVDAALEALNVQLANKGMYFFNAHPYFYNGPDGTGGAFTNWAGVNGFAEWKNVMGAAFNFNLIEHDPGAVAHNRYYVRRLIYDSLDYLDDYTPNYSVFATLNALPDAATYKANAITFLINRGTGDANVGTAAERY